VLCCAVPSQSLCPTPPLLPPPSPLPRRPQPPHHQRLTRPLSPDNVHYPSPISGASPFDRRHTAHNRQGHATVSRFSHTTAVFPRCPPATTALELLPLPRSASPVRIVAWRAHTRATGADAAAHRRHMWRRLVPCRRRRDRRSCCPSPPGAPPPSASSRGARTRAPPEQTLPPVVGTGGDDWCRAPVVVNGTTRALSRRHRQVADGTGRGGSAKRLARPGRFAVAEHRPGSCHVRACGCNHVPEQAMGAGSDWTLWRALA